MFKYKRGYEYLYKNHKYHYKHQIPPLKGKISEKTLVRRKNKEWLYGPNPPQDYEEDWYYWCKYHMVKLQTDLEFCNNCDKLLNPERDNQSYLLSHTIRTKDRFMKTEICSKCRVIEDKIICEFEKCADLKRKIIKISKEQNKIKGAKENVDNT
jgi:hypothetical protein